MVNYRELASDGAKAAGAITAASLVAISDPRITFSEAHPATIAGIGLGYVIGDGLSKYLRPDPVMKASGLRSLVRASGAVGLMMIARGTIGCEESESILDYARKVAEPMTIALFNMPIGLITRTMYDSTREKLGFSSTKE